MVKRELKAMIDYHAFDSANTLISHSNILFCPHDDGFLALQTGIRGVD